MSPIRVNLIAADQVNLAHTIEVSIICFAS